MNRDVAGKHKREEATRAEYKKMINSRCVKRER